MDSDKAAELFHQLEAIVNDHHRDRTCGIPSIGGRSAVKPTASKDYVVRDALVELMTCADVVPSEVCQRMSDLRKQIDALHEYGIDTEPVSRQVPDSSHSKAADLAYRMIAEHFTLEPVFGGWRKETRWRPEEDSTAFNASEERRYANALSSAGILDQQQFWSVVHAWRDIAYKIVEDLAARVRSSPGKLTDETEGRVLLAMLEERDLKLAHRYPEVASWQRLRSHAASKLHSSQGHASIGS